jgi:proteic killer suppression protein
MIVSFKHKGLEKYYSSGSKSGILPQHEKRLRSILARLDVASSAEDMNLPGLSLHKLTGNRNGFFSVSVSGNWRVIFRLEDGNVLDVDYLDYH